MPSQPEAGYGIQYTPGLLPQRDPPTLWLLERRFNTRFVRFTWVWVFKN
jgi:hypothetical protein